MLKTLLISPDQSWIEKSTQSLSENGQVQTSITGKEAQLMAMKSQPDYIFLDLGVREHSGVEVLKYLRIKCPHSYVFAFQRDPTAEKWDEKELLKLGANKVLPDIEAKPLFTFIQELGKITGWETLVARERSASAEAEDVSAQDEEFTRMRVEDFLTDVMAVTDLYVRLGANKYVKIINRGEVTSATQFQKYAQKGAKYIYFPTADRIHFVTYQNEIAAKANKGPGASTEVVFKASRTAHSKLIEELSATGISPSLLEHGKGICLNIYDSAKKNKGVKDLLTCLEEMDPKTLTETFLVTFFSTIISKDLDWVGTRSLEALSMGALLHDVGVLQLPKTLLTIEPSQYTSEQQEEYETHPTLGYEALKKIPNLNPAIKEIVLQHHEAMDGSGFPSAIGSMKIFPLAKIVSLADGFSSFMMDRGAPALDCLKDFVTDPTIIKNYDPQLVKNLIRSVKTKD